MRVHWNREDEGAELRLRWRLDPEDTTIGIGQGGRSVNLITDRCSFGLRLPVDMPGNDLLALAALTVLQPWIRQRLQVDQPVSPEFARAVSEMFSIQIGPVDTTMTPRSPYTRSGLSYSSGADSVATGELLPSDTAYVHFRRIRHPRVPNRATHIRADVLEQLVLGAADRDRSVYIVDSDLEYITSPWPMFPSWVTLFIGVVLLADELDLGTVSFGAILGSRYLGNGYRFTPDKGPDRWAAVFAAAGLPFLRPVVGMTEVMTMTLASESDLGDLSRSCLLGGFNGPCMNCSKCLRKEVLLSGIEEREMSPLLLSNLTADHDVVQPYLGPPPYYFQHIMEFGLARAKGIEETFLADAKRALTPTRASTEWTKSYYTPALTTGDNIPATNLDDIRRQLGAKIPWMTDDEIRTVETWDAEQRISGQA